MPSGAPLCLYLWSQSIVQPAAKYKVCLTDTHSDYVYVLTMNADNKVERMVKIWNASWALRELGWM